MIYKICPKWKAMFLVGEECPKGYFDFLKKQNNKWYGKHKRKNAEVYHNKKWDKVRLPCLMKYDNICIYTDLYPVKCLNMWLNKKENGYMDMAKWKACEVEQLPYDIKGKPVYIGFDMSAKIDLTSVSFIIPLMIDNILKYILFSHFFVPSVEKLREHETKDKMPYSYWAEAGYITVTNTHIVDQQAVWDYTKAFCDKHELKSILCVLTLQTLLK